MQTESLAIADIKLITPSIHRDERGSFSETFSARALAAAGIREQFVQDNHAVSLNANVVRGLHFQIAPHAQGKLLRVTRGSIFDVAVDIRVGSPSFGKNVSAILTADNRTQIWIPAGFAHGYCTLEPLTEVFYKVTDYYSPECDRGLRWDDPDLGIAWPVAAADAILSTKDRLHPQLSELPAYFDYRLT